MICSQCRSANEAYSEFCSSCGAALVLNDKKLISQQAEKDTSDSQTELYKAVVGSKNQDYYLRHFSRFEGQGKTGTSWHWPAFFLTFYWLLYRKMWRQALLYFFAPYLVLILIFALSALAGKVSANVMGIANGVFFISMFVLPPIYANAFYFRHCKNKIAEAAASSPDLQNQLGALSSKGGTSRIAFILMFIFIFLAVIGILAAIAIPAYQQYTSRYRLAEAVLASTQASESVANYYYLHQKIPSSLAQAGFVVPQSIAFKEMSVNGQNGEIVVTMLASPLAGKTLLMTPSLDENGKISWKCQSPDIADKFLPVACRH